MPAWVEFIGRAVGLAITGLIILAPFIVWLSKLMIEKIISHEFENEREALKYQIATLLGRSTKIHDREFETLEAVWEKASASMGSAASVLALFQRSADVTWVEGEQLEHVLADLELPAWQVTAVKTLTGNQRTRKLHEFTMERRRRTAWRDAVAFNDYLIIKGIFLKSEIEAKARALAHLIFELLDEEAWATDDRDGTTYKTKSELAKRIQEDGATLRDEVRSMIAARLWDVDLNRTA